MRDARMLDVFGAIVAVALVLLLSWQSSKVDARLDRLADVAEALPSVVEVHVRCHCWPSCKCCSCPKEPMP